MKLDFFGINNRGFGRPIPQRKSLSIICTMSTAVFAVGVLFFAPGCVERRLLIRSNPPGAMVYVDDYRVGLTPIGTSFTYYGTRKIRLVKDGYQPITVYERISPPWYQIPPFDFFAENILRREIRDTRVLEYQLIPQPVSPPQQLLERAEALRSQAASQPPLPALGAPQGAPSGYSSNVPRFGAPAGVTSLPGQDSPIP